MRLTTFFSPQRHIVCPLGVVMAVLVIGLSAATAAAQLPGAGGGSNAEGSSNRSGLKVLTDAIESGGNLLMDQVRQDEIHDPVDQPRWDSQQSPRHAVMTFLEAMRAVDRGHDEVWPRALRILPKNGAGESQQKQSARWLYECLIRVGPTQPIDLPGEKDVRGSNFKRWEVFPRGTDHRWVWDALDEPPAGKIAVTVDDQGHWRFSQRTIDNAQSLYESLLPLPPSFDDEHHGELFFRVFQPTAERTAWWAWLVLLGSIAAGVVVGLFVKRGMRSVSKWFSNRDRTVLASITRSIGTPASLFVLTVAVGFGLGFIHFGPALSDLRWGLVKVLLVLTVGWLIVELIDFAAELIRIAIKRGDGGPYDRMAVTTIRRTLRIFVFIILVIFVCQNLLGMNVAGLLAGLGIVGLAVSLAAQDSIKNLFGALSIFINRPFVVGDWVRFKGEWGEHLGQISDVGIQCTQLRSVKGELVTFPNMLFIDREIENLSARPYLRTELNLSLTYDSDSSTLQNVVDAVTELLRSDTVVQSGKLDLEQHPPRVSVTGFADYYINVRAYHWYCMGDGGAVQRDSERGWYSYLDHCTLVNKGIVQLFEEHGLDFAFPTRTLYLNRENHDRGLRSGEQPGEGDTENSPASSDDDN